MKLLETTFLVDMIKRNFDSRKFLVFLNIVIWIFSIAFAIFAFTAKMSENVQLLSLEILVAVALTTPFFYHSTGTKS